MKEERLRLIPRPVSKDTNTFRIISVILILVVIVVVLIASYTSNYDTSPHFFIIGGGPSGSVLSHNLVSASFPVTLFEAGDASQASLGGLPQYGIEKSDVTPFDIPFLWPSITQTPEFHWPIPGVLVAKVLGGCGVHNAMLYVRALPQDIESWGTEAAAAGWNWNTALQLYIAAENYTGEDTLSSNNYVHGRSGLIQTSRATDRYVDHIAPVFIAAAVATGIPESLDFNAPNSRYGAGYYHFNIRNGKRDGAAAAYLGPILRNSNFTLRLNSNVKKLIISSENVVTAIEFVNGTRTSVLEGGVVVLAAGTINTARILLRSGIGARDELREVGVPVKKHLSGVGKNVQDHPVVAMSFENLVRHNTSNSVTNFTQQFEAYQKNRKSSRLASAGLSAGAFIVPPGNTDPQIQLTVFSKATEPHVVSNISSVVVENILVTVALLKPEARNRVTLKNADGDIRIESEVPETNDVAERLTALDISKLRWGIRAVRDIMAQDVTKSIVGKELSPGNAFSDAQIDDWIRANVARNSHWVGSARLGSEASGGVVNTSTLSVHGISNLKIVDASVIPQIPNGNVHSTVVMVASHASSLIIREQQYAVSTK